MGMALFFIDIQMFFYENGKNEYSRERKGGVGKRKESDSVFILSLKGAWRGQG